MARASSRRNMSRTWSVGDNIGASNEIIDRRSAQNAIDLQTAAVLARLQLSPIASAPRQLSPLSVPRDARLPSSPSSAASPLMPLRNADLTAVARYRVKSRDMRPSNGTAAAAKAIEQQATEHQLARRASNEPATAALAAKAIEQQKARGPPEFRGRELRAPAKSQRVAEVRATPAEKIPLGSLQTPLVSLSQTTTSVPTTAHQRRRSPSAVEGRRFELPK